MLITPRLCWASACGRGMAATGEVGEASGTGRWSIFVMRVILARRRLSFERRSSCLADKQRM